LFGEIHSPHATLGNKVQELVAWEELV
jgi:hypothetical protein